MAHQIIKLIIHCFILSLLTASIFAQNSLPPIEGENGPQSIEELWTGYDSRTEALDVKVIHEWDEAYEGSSLKIQILTFFVGTFKGKTSRIPAFYGYPKEAKAKVPVLVQLHSGGLRADKNSVKADAANGYASLSLNWGGRKLQDQKPGESGTDWGAIDPTQKHVSHYFRHTLDDKTVESVYSPRNNNWFILSLATRQGLTFVEQQPIVDAEKLGVHGHSMGGAISGQVAGLDPRIKAAVPSCGGAGITQVKNITRPGASVTGITHKEKFSGTVPSVGYIGFATQRAETLFTEPKISLDS